MSATTAHSPRACLGHVIPIDYRRDARDPYTYTQKIRRTVPLMLEFLDSEATPAAKAEWIRRVFHGGPRPLLRLPRDCWVSLFREFAPRQEPLLNEPTVTMWRAASPEHARGLSWTPDRHVADLFLGSWHGHPDNVLRSCDVEDSWILAQLDRKEFVVDVPLSAPLVVHTRRGGIA